MKATNKAAGASDACGLRDGNNPAAEHPNRLGALDRRCSVQKACAKKPKAA